MQLHVRDLRIVYRTKTGKETLAVDGANLSVAAGEFVCILGPSGCGKSTMLMAIDGLLTPTAGEIQVQGQPISGPGPDRAVVFQEFALMPWLTVHENVCFGMEMRGVPAAQRKERAEHYIGMVGLQAFAKAYPHQLSGGMRQRVGIARALAAGPAVLLMDEPFGALDAQTREFMAGELLRIWDQERKTVLFVTHSLDEAIYLADRVVVMTARPTRVKQEIRIDLPRPRSHALYADPAFMAYRQLLWGLLEEEVQLVAAGGGAGG